MHCLGGEHEQRQRDTEGPCHAAPGWRCLVEEIRARHVLIRRFARGADRALARGLEQGELRRGFGLGLGSRLAFGDQRGHAVEYPGALAAAHLAAARR